MPQPNVLALPRGSPPPSDADCLLLLRRCAGATTALDGALQPVLDRAFSVDRSLSRSGGFVAADCSPGGRLVLALAGPLDRDFDDARAVADAANAAIKRCVAAGAESVVLFVDDDIASLGGDFRHSLSAAIIGCLHAAYAPLMAREHAAAAAAAAPSSAAPLEPLRSLYVMCPSASDDALRTAVARCANLRCLSAPSTSIP